MSTPFLKKHFVGFLPFPCIIGQRDTKGGGTVDDRSLMDRIASGDEAALQTLLRRHGSLLRYIIAPILPDARDREECFADVSVRLWQTAGSFDASKGTLRGWLTVLARNCALNRARGLRTETALTDDMPHGAGSAEDALLRQERSRLLVRAVKSLTDGEQTLFYRKYYYCQSTAQMAAELGLTERGVEGRLYRLRQKLRELLGGDFCE